MADKSLSAYHTRRRDRTAENVLGQQDTAGNPANVFPVGETGRDRSEQRLFCCLVDDVQTFDMIMSAL